MKPIARSLSCPACGCKKTRVIDSRNTGTYIRRRRDCKSCHTRFTTTEIILVGEDHTIPTERDLYRHFIRSASDWLLADEIYKRMSTRQHEFGSNSRTLRDSNEESKESEESKGSFAQTENSQTPQDNSRRIEEDTLRRHNTSEDKATEE